MPGEGPEAAVQRHESERGGAEQVPEGGRVDQDRGEPKLEGDAQEQEAVAEPLLGKPPYGIAVRRRARSLAHS